MADQELKDLMGVVPSALPVMMTRRQINEYMLHLQDNLTNWQEPNGLLVPTEPDPIDRAMTRIELRAALTVLRMVLGLPVDADATDRANLNDRLIVEEQAVRCYQEA